LATAQCRCHILARCPATCLPVQALHMAPPCFTVKSQIPNDSAATWLCFAIDHRLPIIRANVACNPASLPCNGKPPAWRPSQVSATADGGSTSPRFLSTSHSIPSVLVSQGAQRADSLCAGSCCRCLAPSRNHVDGAAARRSCALHWRRRRYRCAGGCGQLGAGCCRGGR
jgi:hypothetical protein